MTLQIKIEPLAHVTHSQTVPYQSITLCLSLLSLYHQTVSHYHQTLSHFSLSPNWGSVFGVSERRLGMREGPIEARLEKREESVSESTGVAVDRLAYFSLCA